MKLLTFLAHESYLHTLAKLGHPMDVIVNLPGHHSPTWDERMRPVPDNVRLLPVEEFMADPPEFDCVIGHNISDLLQVKHLPGPRVLTLHSSLTGRLSQEESGIDPREMSSMVVQYMSMLSGVLVFVSEMKRSSWDIDARVIRLAVDTADYDGYHGSESSALRVVNHITAKTDFLRWDLQEAVFEDLPCKLVGVNPDFPDVHPSRDWDHLKDLYRSYRMYVHTAQQGMEDAWNTSTLEAMATGMPVICSQLPGSLVEDGVSGFVSNDPEVLRAGVRRLLADQGLATEMGRAARTRVAEEFSLKAFIDSWERTLAESCARYRANSTGA
jgi:glycosyltransferase involved in cell wall biosynthesis